MRIYGFKAHCRRRRFRRKFSKKKFFFLFFAFRLFVSFSNYLPHRIILPISNSARTRVAYIFFNYLRLRKPTNLLILLQYIYSQGARLT